LAGSSIRVICGPTAAGKSAVALWLAQRHRAAIISADSRQVYRGFDIGTAKPTHQERLSVPHFGIDVLDPAQRYSAAAWADDAERWIAHAQAAGLEPLIVGGTGFYLRALFGTLFHEPALDPRRREALESFLRHMPTEELRRWCAALDPARAHLGRTQLVRGVEIALLTGERVSALHARAPRPPRRTARYLLVDPGPALASRIAERVDRMLDGGWITEAARLAGQVPADAPAWKATGYDVVRALAAGAIERPAAREQVVIATRQYAKRQRTWFRHQLDPRLVRKLDPTARDWQDRAEQWWHGATEA
jgi:tRNA dimethylallyltransferase